MHQAEFSLSTGPVLAELASLMVWPPLQNNSICIEQSDRGVLPHTNTIAATSDKEKKKKSSLWCFFLSDLEVQDF